MNYVDIRNEGAYYHYLNRQQNDDLFLLTFGHEHCLPDKPARFNQPKNHYTLHYIISGHGDFKLENQSFNHLGAGDFFLIPPNSSYWYQQDSSQPWEYLWIEFGGIQAKRLCQNALLDESSPVYHTDSADIRDSLLRLLIVPQNNIAAEYHVMAHLYLVFSQIINERRAESENDPESRTDWVQAAKKIIDARYCDNGLTLESISQELHINRCYLSRIFKQTIGTSLKKYIITLRMRKACELLEEGSYSVKEVSQLVGYSDPHHFSSEFKRIIQCPPSLYHAEGDSTD